MKLQIVQVGEGKSRDLFIWSMGDVQETLRKGAPKDTIVYYFAGNGTSAYEAPPSISEIKKYLATLPEFKETNFKTTTIMGWSAGGRAVQNQLIGAKSELPNAVIVADGLYAGYVDPTTKKIDTTKLQAMATYFALAASSPNKATCVLWHSDIFTPGYASSGECCEWVRKEAEAKLGLEKVSQEIPPALDGRPITSYWRLGNAVLIGYSGKDKNEHIAEVHMVDEVLQTYLPWASDANEAVVGDSVFFPEVVLTDPTTVESFAGYGMACVSRALSYEARGVHEYDDDVMRMLHLFGCEAPNNWCSVLVGECIDYVSRVYGKPKPIAGSAAAKTTMAQLQKTGRWTPIASMKFEDIKPGMVIVFDRYDPSNPLSQSWWGHIGFVVSTEMVKGVPTIHTVEGNVSNKVSKTSHDFRAAKILGFGSLD